MGSFPGSRRGGSSSAPVGAVFGGGYGACLEGGEVDLLMSTSLWYSALAISLAVLSPACVSYQPVRNMGGTKAPEGLEVSVLREICSQNVDPQWPGADLVEPTLETQVRNMTS